MKKYVLVSAFLSLAVLLLATPLAHAQRGGGGGRGGYGGGRGGYGYGRGYGYGGIGIGIYGAGYGYGYGYPYYVDPVVVVPRVSYYPQVLDFPPQPEAAPTPAPMPQAAASSAQIRVILADPQAIVLFDGQKTTSTGNVRNFHTPPLSPDGPAQYKIKAISMVGGREVVQDQTIQVSAGQLAVVDFTPKSESLPAPTQVK